MLGHNSCSRGPPTSTLLNPFQAPHPSKPHFPQPPPPLPTLPPPATRLPPPDMRSTALSTATQSAIDQVASGGQPAVNPTMAATINTGAQLSSTGTNKDTRGQAAQVSSR